MSGCGEISEEELSRIIVLSVFCAVLTCCFGVWVVACCVILFKKDRRGEVIRKTREERFGSQAVNLVKPGQTLEDNRQSKILESPEKIATFGRKKGKDIANNLKVEAAEKPLEHGIQDISLEKSVTFDTFGVKPQQKLSQVTPYPILEVNEVKTISNPTYEPPTEIINDEDSLPLVQDTPIRRSSKSDLAKRFSSGAGENNGLEADAIVEGPYENLGPKKYF